MSGGTETMRDLTPARLDRLTAELSALGITLRRWEGEGDPPKSYHYGVGFVRSDLVYSDRSQVDTVLHEAGHLYLGGRVPRASTGSFGSFGNHDEFQIMVFQVAIGKRIGRSVTQTIREMEDIGYGFGHGARCKERTGRGWWRTEGKNTLATDPRLAALRFRRT